METKTKMERFADFINAMSFSEVIAFFNFTMEDMMQLENHAMYDYHNEEDAIEIIKNIGIENFLENVVYNPTQEERCVMYQTDGMNLNGKTSDIDRWSWGFNPWVEILDGYADWILSYVEDIYKEYGDDCFMLSEYPALKDVIKEPKKKVRVCVSRVVRKIVEVEADSYEDALNFVNDHSYDYDPMTQADCDWRDLEIEILPN